MRFFLIWCLLLYASTTFGSNSIIEDEYIVVLKSGFNVSSFSSFTSNGDNEVVKKYPIINGMLVKMDKVRALELNSDPSVKYIEPNKRVYAIGTQANPPWGLDRIDARSGLDKKYTYTKTGAGVNVYVIDTGIRATHSEFTGRVKQGYSAVGSDTNDCAGHGTHVSATILGKTYGVAKGAVVYPVRVLDCDGSGSDAGVIDGIDWVANNAKKPAVANMSLGGDTSQALNDAVENAISRGVVFAVAAGNSSDDACNYSPASAPNAITVAASDSGDNPASFTSFGSCVDVFAPGVSVLSAGISSDTSTATMSGTSMASPHVAGVVALYLESYPSASPKKIIDKINSVGTKGAISNSKGSPNVLVYSNPEGSSPNPPPTPPPPTPTPDPTVPPECASGGCYYKTGHLANSKTYDVHPISYMYVSQSKELKAFVKGNADFDLYMYAYTDSNWKLIAKANTDNWNETITYKAVGGFYYSWIVILKSPNTSGGDYSIWIKN